MRRLLLLVFVAVILGVTAALTILFVHQGWYLFGSDAYAYIVGADAVQRGLIPGTVPTPATGPLQNAPPYIYPPLLAVLFVPLPGLPVATALWVWSGILAVGTVVLVALLARLVGWRAALLAVLGLFPTWLGLLYGQVNALIAVLLALALVELERDHPRSLGAALALGALLKITPGVALVLFAIRGRLRVVASAGLLAVLVVAVTLPIVGWRAWYVGSLLALGYAPEHHMLRSWTALLYRYAGPIPAWGLTGGLLLVTCWRGRAVSAPLAFAAATLVPLLVARVVWDHHAVLALPALAVLWRQGSRGQALAAAAWAATTIGALLAPVAPLALPFALPLTLTACWLACCWPVLLVGQPNRELSLAPADARL